MNDLCVRAIGTPISAASWKEVHFLRYIGVLEAVGRRALQVMLPTGRGGEERATCFRGTSAPCPSRLWCVFVVVGCVDFWWSLLSWAVRAPGALLRGLIFLWGGFKAVVAAVSFGCAFVRAVEVGASGMWMGVCWCPCCECHTMGIGGCVFGVCAASGSVWGW